MGGRKMNFEEDQRVATLVRMLRLEARMSQTQLGEAVGVTFQQIQKYESGANRITSGMLVRLAAALGVQPQRFFVQASDGNSDAAGHLLELLANNRNLRALTAFANIQNVKVKDAFLDVLEQISRRKLKAGVRASIGADE